MGHPDSAVRSKLSSNTRTFRMTTILSSRAVGCRRRRRSRLLGTVRPNGAMPPLAGARVRRPQRAAAPFTLQPGDHICIIGNTLAERMQHDGWLETLLHARFPQHDLVIRNLGFSGDEIATRLALEELRHARRVAERQRRADRRYQENRLERHEHQGRRHLRVLRLQRVVRRRGRAADVQAAARRVHQAHARAEVQRQVGAAPRAVLADRARGSAQPRPARRQGEQRAARALHRRRWREVAEAHGVRFVDLFAPTERCSSATPRRR